MWSNHHEQDLRHVVCQQHFLSVWQYHLGVPH
uniref:Uncharacterized protein n=1 Tax=Arundo donax TaxID=35708 RepID=A0A0A9EJ46_ARUDO